MPLVVLQDSEDGLGSFVELISDLNVHQLCKYQFVKINLGGHHFLTHLALVFVRWSHEKKVVGVHRP